MIDKAIVIGSINYDTFLKVDHLPMKGENILASAIATSCGGKGANQAVQCAKLGLKTYMAGCVGDDSIAGILLESLRKNGVDVSRIRRGSGPSGQAYVTSAEDGSLFGTIMIGANWEVNDDDVDSVDDLVDENTAIILQMEIPMDAIRRAIVKYSAKGAKIYLNAAPAAPLEDEYFSKCAFAVFNESEAMFYLKRKFDASEAESAIKELSGRLGCPCIFTLGPEGAISCKDGVCTFCPAADVPVVETTGAGDSFIGGFIFAQSRDPDIMNALRFASKCSGFTIQKIGAQDSMPCLEDIAE